MDEEDEYFGKFEDGDDEVKEVAYFNSIKELSEYVKANDINIVEEYEGGVCILIDSNLLE